MHALAEKQQRKTQARIKRCILDGGSENGGIGDGSGGDSGGKDDGGGDVRGAPDGGEMVLVHTE